MLTPMDIDLIELPDDLAGPDPALARVRQWLEAPHIRRWWGDPEEQFWLTQVRPEGSGHALVCADGEPVGYIRWVRPDRELLDAFGMREIPWGSVDLDICIGEQRVAGQGVGTRALQEMMRRLLLDGTVPFVGMSTSYRNRAAMRAYERAGFRNHADFEDPELGRCFVMLADRRAVVGVPSGHLDAVFESDRLRMRRWLPEDAPDFALLWCDPRVLQERPASDWADAQRILHEMIEASEALPDGQGSFAVIEKASGQTVGNILIRPAPFADDLEVACQMQHRAWGRDIATEASRATVQHCFGALGRRRVVAVSLPDNSRSMTIARHLGFRRDGTILYRGQEHLLLVCERDL